MAATLAWLAYLQLFSLCNELIIVDLVSVIFSLGGSGEEEEQEQGRNNRRRKTKKNVSRRENENKLTTNDLMGGDETRKLKGARSSPGSRREANVRKSI